MDFKNAKIMFCFFGYNRADLLKACAQAVNDAKDDRVETHMWIDDSGSHPDVDEVADASGFEVHRPDQRLGGFIQREAVHIFLAEPERGDLLAVADGDMLVGRSVFQDIRDLFHFWWGEGRRHTGMMCGGIRKEYFSMRGHVDKNGKRMIMNHGGEAFSVFPRSALELVVEDRGGKVPWNVCKVKNSMQRVRHSRGTPITPFIPVAHIGAFNSTRNPDRSPWDHLFLDDKGRPLNPRPDLFDVEKALETVSG